jgi:hypothetical protein
MNELIYMCRDVIRDMIIPELEMFDLCNFALCNHDIMDMVKHYFAFLKSSNNAYWVPRSKAYKEFYNTNYHMYYHALSVLLHMPNEGTIYNMLCVNRNAAGKLHGKIKIKSWKLDFARLRELRTSVTFRCYNGVLHGPQSFDNLQLNYYMGVMHGNQIVLDGSFACTYKYGNIVYCKDFNVPKIRHGTSTQRIINKFGVLQKHKIIVACEIVAEYATRNGKPHGDCVKFYDNHKVKSIRNYENGELHGNYVKYDKYGKTIIKLHFINGKLCDEKFNADLQYMFRRLELLNAV